MSQKNAGYNRRFLWMTIFGMMNSSNTSFSGFGLTAKQKRRVLLLIPVAISLLVVYFWPAQPCNKVVAKFGPMQQMVETSGMLAKLDSLAFGGHCDTFSLVYDKSLWIVPKCGRSSAQFRDSVQMPGASEAIESIIKQAKIGAVYYHYPQVSFELNEKFRGGYDFRLVYSRTELEAEDVFWSSCEQATTEKKERYHIFLSKHWYVVARKLKSFNRN